MLELFQRQEVNDSFRSQTDFSLRSINTSGHYFKVFEIIAPKIWNLVPQDIWSANSLSQFIRKINSWIPGSCPHNLCHKYNG